MNSSLKYFFTTVLIFSCLSSFAQKDKEIRKEQRLPKKIRLNAFLNEPYFYLGVSGGLSINLPLNKTNAISLDGTYTPFLERKRENPFVYLQFGLYAGFQIKKHHVFLQYEELKLFYGSNSLYYDQSYYFPSSYSREVIPYFSASYNYDLLGKGRTLGLQAGMHLGITLYNKFEKSESGNSALTETYDNGNTIIVIFEEQFTHTRLQTTGFAFGPNLNFEVNMTRWVSFNIYQQLTYAINPIMKTTYTYEIAGGKKGEGENNNSLFNYSFNLSLRFKMYLPKTRFKVAEKLATN